MARTMPLFAQTPISVSLPTVNGKQGASITVPVTVGNTTGSAIIAFDATITYDATVLRAVSAVAAGRTKGWTVISNLNTPGQLRITAFHVTALSGSGTLLNLGFTVIGTACAESTLTLTSFVFNEGNPAAATQQGSFRVTPCAPPTPTPTPPPTATPTPTPLAPGTQIYLSTSANSRIGSLAFNDEDILHFDPTLATWQLYFDGSDVGIGNVDVEDFALQADGSILMSFDKPLRMAIDQQLATVDDADLVRFIPTQLGPTTSGSFSRVLTGATVGLTTAGENIDAMDVAAEGRMILSTSGTFTAGSVRGGDEDLFVIDANHNVSLLFDGSAVGLTAGSEDLGAVWVDGSDLYLTTKGGFNVRGRSNALTGTAQDIFICHLLSSGINTDCHFTPFFSGRAVGLTVAIDGLHLGHEPAGKPVSSTILPADPQEDGLAPYEVVEETALPEPDAELDEYDRATSAETATTNTIFLPVITTR